LIVQSAIQGGAEQLLSENLINGRKISGVEIKNPFI
jgi:predicted nucleic acid-binding protein